LRAGNFESGLIRVKFKYDSRDYSIWQGITFAHMEDFLPQHRDRPVAIWLLAGVFMIMVQVLLGGITRLTGSGLSITQWDPIVGAFPPLSHQAWMHAFGLYRQTPQFRLSNPDFNLGDFKAIFFWEYLHRLWARLIGIVFLVPFILFLLQRRFRPPMIRPLVILFMLGAMQGAIGWIMVESGLTGDNIRVDHIRLALHFLMALLLLTYTLWFALTLLVDKNIRVSRPSLKRILLAVGMVLVIQLTYGAFMAGLHAALYAPTWPDMNGRFIPSHLFRSAGSWINDPMTVQFMHRGLAYLLLALIIIWTAASRTISYRIRLVPLATVCLQIVLGVLTVTRSRISIPIGLAVCHQLGAMILLIAVVWNLFLISAQEERIQMRFL
jgi:cytochrome c oxidase assembly protein subunit 15